MIPKSKESDRNVFVIGRQSRRNNSRRLELLQDSDSSIRRYSNQNGGRKNAFQANTSPDTTESSKVNFKNLLTIFLKRSSIYALNQVGNSSSVRRKVFWTLILVIGLLGSGIQISQYLKAYFSYPVVVNMDSLYSLDQEFPAVTICNINRVKNESILCLKKTLNWKNCTDAEKDKLEDENIQPSVTYDATCDTFSNDISDITLQSNMWKNLFFSLDDESRSKYGHQGKDFIRSCSFNGEKCTLFNFTEFTDYDYGNCFTFNAANDSTPALTTPFVGPNGGLELELDLEVESYTPQAKAIGAIFQVHDPYHDPDIGQRGFKVSPGFETSVALMKNMMIRLKAPYKDRCKDYPNGENMGTCNDKCLYNIKLKSCKCELMGSGGVRHCDLTIMSDVCCLYAAENETCDCPLSCNETTYEINTFSAIFPSKAYYEENPIIRSEANEKLNYDQYRETIVKLKIYYDTLETVIYQQKAMYQSSELFSQIGGQMGLWLGLSLVAIFECIENIVLLWKYRHKTMSQILSSQ